MTTVLGIDAALTKTGLATKDWHDTVRTKPKDGDGRLVQLQAEVADAIMQHQPVLAVLEDLPTHAMSAGKTGMAQGVVRLVLNLHEVPYLTVSAASLKKFATDNGRADKEMMHLHLVGHHPDLSQFDYEINNDDEVDARWLAEVGHHYLDSPVFNIPQDRVDRVLNTLKEHNNG